MFGKRVQYIMSQFFFSTQDSSVKSKPTEPHLDELSEAKVYCSCSNTDRTTKSPGKYIYLHISYISRSTCIFAWGHTSHMYMRYLATVHFFAQVSHGKMIFPRYCEYEPIMPKWDKYHNVTEGHWPLLLPVSRATDIIFACSQWSHGHGLIAVCSSHQFH